MVGSGLAPRTDQAMKPPVLLDCFTSRFLPVQPQNCENIATRTLSLGLG